VEAGEPGVAEEQQRENCLLVARNAAELSTPTEPQQRSPSNQRTVFKGEMKTRNIFRANTKLTILNVIYYSSLGAGRGNAGRVVQGWEEGLGGGQWLDGESRRDDQGSSQRHVGRRGKEGRVQPLGGIRGSGGRSDQVRAGTEGEVSERHYILN